MDNNVKQDASDIKADSLILRLAPAALRPYLRLARMDRPIGTWLLLLPCWWSLALASNGHPDLYLMALFAIGSLIMRGAGCTVNDIVDRDFDGKVARTALRPIPAGEVSVKQAVAFLGFLLLMGLAVLLQFNTFTILLGISSLLLVALYPFMKRITYWPQAVLGLTFNWGALMGWAAVKGELSLAPGLLYAAGFFWTLGYDTIYAHQDKDDDEMIGVKSTALKLGTATPKWLALFYSLTVVCLLGAGYMIQAGAIFYGITALGAAHLVWQIKRLDIDDATNCLALFKANRHFGLIVLLAILLASIRL